MSPTSQRLGQIVVRANPNPNGNERPTAGSTEKTLTGEQLYRLPVDASDPALVASLAPGVILLGGSDSTANSFSIAGQRPDQNQITLDGLSFGSGSVPAEAVRSTRVITNTYDVARGQFTGGQVASTTRSGTNVLQGSVGYVMNQPDLEFPDTSSESDRAVHVEPAQLRARRSVLAGPVVLVPLRAGERADQRHQHAAQRERPAARALERRAGLGAALPRHDGRTTAFRRRRCGVPSDALRNRSSALTRMDFALGDRTR